MKIVFLDAETVGPNMDFTQFETLGEFSKYEDTEASKVIERLTNVTVAICNKTKITKEVMDNCPSLKLICVAATGTNNIDLDYAETKGIKVCNAAGYSTHSVVQLTYALLFSVVMKINEYDKYIKSGEYSKSSLFTSYTHSFNELHGKQVGIIGMGNIGKKSAEVANVFGAKVAYYSTSGKNNNTDYTQLSLDQLLSTSDVVLIHAPLNDATRDLINLEKLNLMKSTAFVINTGRGYIINEADLATAINNKTIAGAGLDVFASEPMKEDNPLLSVKYPERLVLTPHIAWASVEARTLLLNIVRDNIINWKNS